MAKKNSYYRVINRKWDSNFEKKLFEGCLSHCEYHNKDYTINYTVDHKYYPDFIWSDGTTTYLIEAKGRFEDTAVATKYIWIRDSLPAFYELVFLFQNPPLPMPRSRVRKDGTRQTHKEWADRKGFRWFTEKNIHELFEGDKDGTE